MVRASAGRDGDQAALDLDDADLVGRAARRPGADHGDARRAVGGARQPLARVVPQYAPGHLDRIDAIERALPDRASRSPGPPCAASACPPASAAGARPRPACVVATGADREPRTGGCAAPHRRRGPSRAAGLLLAASRCRRGAAGRSPSRASSCSTGSSPTARPAPRFSRGCGGRLRAARPVDVLDEGPHRPRLRHRRRLLRGRHRRGGGAVPARARAAASPCRWPGSWPRPSGVRGPSAACRCRSSRSARSADRSAPIARLGGTLLIAAVTVTAGVAVSALLDRRWVPAAAAAAVVARRAGRSPRSRPSGDGHRPVDPASGSCRAAGRRAPATTTPTRRSCSNATYGPARTCPKGLDLVRLARGRGRHRRSGSTEPQFGARLAQLARRLDTTAGRRRGRGRRRATLPQRLGRVEPRGRGRSVATRRSTACPFGEYVPLRSLLEPFAGGVADRPGRDRRQRPPVLDVAGTRVGVVISWEVFFGHRARAAVRNGGQALLNPTNGSSYTGTLVQTQQIASSRLRAIETGRWVVQVAPTGLQRVRLTRAARCSTAPRSASPPSACTTSSSAPAGPSTRASATAPRRGGPRPARRRLAPRPPLPPQPEIGALEGR